MRKRGVGHFFTRHHHRCVACTAALCPSIDAVAQINDDPSKADGLLTPLLTKSHSFSVPLSYALELAVTKRTEL